MHGGMCSRTLKRHVVLQGVDSDGVVMTLRAQPYPLSLCAALAGLIKRQCQFGKPVRGQS